MNVTLIGGGWKVDAQRECVQPFLAATQQRAEGTPRIGFVWIDEGDGTHWGRRWVDLLQQFAEFEPADLRVAIDTRLETTQLSDIDGLFVCGGLTPAYAKALATASGAIRDAVVNGLPYAGSSAGAAVASTHAVVGGWLHRGVVVCPDDAAEDLEEVTVMPGLGIVEEMVDVHASAWGTLPRLAAALDGTAASVGLAIDEDTAWHIDGDDARVLGVNAVHRLAKDDQGLRWSPLTAGRQ